MRSQEEPDGGLTFSNLGLLIRTEPITYPRLGKNVARRGRIGFELLSQVADEDAQVLVLLDVIATPYGSQQGVMREHLSGVVYEINEEIKFLRRQTDVATTNGNIARFQINMKVSLFQDGLCGFV